MKIIFISILMVIALVLYSCKTQKESTEKIDETTESIQSTNYFIIGSGGGFTGKYNEFKVYSTGIVEKLNENANAYEPYTEISKEKIENFFLQLNYLNLESMNIDHPGNMTFYIKINTDTGRHTVKWGDAKFQIKKEVEVFFESVMTEIYKKER